MNAISMLSVLPTMNHLTMKHLETASSILIVNKQLKPLSSQCACQGSPSEEEVVHHSQAVSLAH